MEIVGDYEYSKKDLIGHGAFAVVFKGRRRKATDEPVAIKCITKKNLAKSQNLLSKEINILKELSGLHHENVVALLDCKETQHHVYLVMEYCNGGDLADYLQAKGTLSEDTIRRFLRQIAGAMRALNLKGIVHRDLKPQNILLCHQDKAVATATPADITLKIADFGFARFLEDGVMAGTLCGSPMYMAPEVIMSLQYDAKADLWSVGTIVYQCLTGKAPFRAQTPQQLKQYYEKNPNLQPNIPAETSPDLRDLLMRLLKRNAKDRMDFEEFFCHQYLNEPLPLERGVGRNQSRMSIGEGSVIHTVSSSPLSGVGATTPPSQLSSRVKEEVRTAVAVPAPLAENDDFVLVPEGLDDDGARAGRGSGGRSSPQVTGRPTTLPMPTDSPSASSSSLPIPVPSQLKAYEQIQRSNRQSPSSPNMHKIVAARAIGFESPSAMAVDRHSVSSQEGDVSQQRTSSGSMRSLSPPNVQFTVGTPPTNQGLSSRSPVPPVTKVVQAGALRSVSNGSRVVNGTPQGSQHSASPLAAIAGSPAKVNSPLDMEHSPSPIRQLKTPFGLVNCRSKTFATLPGDEHLMERCASGSQLKRLSLQMPGGSGGSVAMQSGSRGSAVGPYVCAPSVLWNRSDILKSPPRSSPIMFAPPELTEETLMDDEHNETVSKLNFVLDLVECLMELAKSRAFVPRAASSQSSPTGGVGVREQATEQLVLYLKSLHLLSSSLQLAKSEMAADRLQPSHTVKNILIEMNRHYHTCLDTCHRLQQLHPVLRSVTMATAMLTADKLMYTSAIQMCQTAVMDELLGDPLKCFSRYRAAHIMLHSLSQQADNPRDHQLLVQYRNSVEKRLLFLHSQGYVQAHINARN